MSQCTSKFCCRKCKRIHHISLCNSVPSNTQKSATDDKKANNLDTFAELFTPTSHSKTPQEDTTCLFKTAVSPIIADGIKMMANILFDEGAQCSFISVAMATELCTLVDSTHYHNKHRIIVLWKCINNVSETWSCHGGNRDKL